MPDINVRSLDDAKALYRDEKKKVVGSVQAIVSSRLLIAVFAAFTLAFGGHLVFAPARLPSLGGLSVASFGLPPSVDFGLAGQAAQDAAAAAERQGAGGQVQGFLAENAGLIPILNGIGFGAALVLLIWALLIQSRIRKQETLAAS